MEEDVGRTLRAFRTLVIVDRASLAHTVKVVSRHVFSHRSCSYNYSKLAQSEQTYHQI